MDRDDIFDLIDLIGKAVANAHFKDIGQADDMQKVLSAILENPAPNEGAEEANWCQKIMCEGAAYKLERIQRRFAIGKMSTERVLGELTEVINNLRTWNAKLISPLWLSTIESKLD